MKLFILLLVTSVFTGCSQSDQPQYNLKIEDSVTLITSTTGNGDNGYNDLILSGAMRFYSEHEDDLRFSLQKPENINEAKSIFDQWKETTAGQSGQHVIILASDNYLPLMSDASFTPATNQHILLFESDNCNLHENVHTFRICRYGASYLCGTAASESPEAHIVAAKEDEALLCDAISGFSDGYRDASGKHAQVHYLAEDESGYSMPNKAYQLAGTFGESFVFPLAGGSNSGLFKYTREDEFSMMLISGMDVDCSDYSTRVPFSLVIHIDAIIYKMLNQWSATGELPRHTDYTLSDKDAIEVAANAFFLERAIVFRDYYIDDAYWKNLIDENYEAACRKEVMYYE